ncbi:hypothetical protein ALMP_02180 [Streptomyces sp. A012304]|nr:hypothetical protein ALMP_02180 [Streptomyces sp. A012304]
MPDHDDQVLRVQLTGGGQDVTHEAAAADLVQNLRCGRLHTGALTRCENDDGCRANGAHGVALRLCRGGDIRRIPGCFLGDMRVGPDLAGSGPELAMCAL